METENIDKNWIENDFWENETTDEVLGDDWEFEKVVILNFSYPFASKLIQEVKNRCGAREIFVKNYSVRFDMNMPFSDQFLNLWKTIENEIIKFSSEYRIIVNLPGHTVISAMTVRALEKKGILYEIIRVSRLKNTEGLRIAELI